MRSDIPHGASKQRHSVALRCHIDEQRQLPLTAESTHHIAFVYLPFCIFRYLQDCYTNLVVVLILSFLLLKERGAVKSTPLLMEKIHLTVTYKVLTPLPFQDCFWNGRGKQTRRKTSEVTSFLEVTEII